jgi:hypothetical protein
VWIYEGYSDLRLEKTAQCGAPSSVLFTKYYYDDENKEDKMGGACSPRGKDETYKNLVEKREGKRHLGRHRHR